RVFSRSVNVSRLTISCANFYVGLFTSSNLLLAPVLRNPGSWTHVFVDLFVPRRLPGSIPCLVGIWLTSECDDLGVGRQFGSSHEIHRPTRQKSVLEAVALAFWPERLLFDRTRNICLTIGKLSKD